jgi:hypothetical protein
MASIVPSFTQNHIFTDFNDLQDSNISAEGVRDRYQRASLATYDERKSSYVAIASYRLTPDDIMEALFELKDEKILIGLVYNPKVTSHMLSRIYAVFKNKNFDMSSELLYAIMDNIVPTPANILEDILKTHNDFEIIQNIAWRASLTEKIITSLMEKPEPAQYYEGIVHAKTASEKTIIDIYNKIYPMLKEIKQSDKDAENEHNESYSIDSYMDCVNTAKQIARNSKTPTYILEELAPMLCLEGEVAANRRITMDIIRKIPFEHISAPNAYYVINHCKKGDEDVFNQLIDHKDWDIRFKALLSRMAPIEKIYKECSNKTRTINPVSDRLSPDEYSNAMYNNNLATLRNMLFNEKHYEFKTFLLKEASIDITKIPHEMVTDLLGWT